MKGDVINTSLYKKYLYLKHSRFKKIRPFISRAKLLSNCFYPFWELEMKYVNCITH